MYASLEQMTDKELDKELKRVSKLMFGIKPDKDYKAHVRTYRALLREKGQRAKKQCGHSCYS